VCIFFAFPFQWGVILGINAYLLHDMNTTEQRIGLFLTIRINDALFQVHHDMNAPLSHYFVYTGHNSYLTGNQLSSDCSDMPIIKALQRGVRVIELDLWPNSDKDDIDVVHGRC